MDAKEARVKSNEVRKQMVIKMNMSKIDSMIKVAVSKGLSRLEVNLNDITIGSETFSEAGTMLKEIENNLKNLGFTCKISPCGRSVIEW